MSQSESLAISQPSRNRVTVLMARRHVTASVVAVSLVLAVLLTGCGSSSDAAGNGTEETWSVEGPLLAWEDSLWIVDALPIVVPSELGMDERRWLGAIVSASGTVAEDG